MGLIKDFRIGSINQLIRNLFQPFFDPSYPGGDNPGPLPTIQFSGTGFGSAPPVVVYADWSEHEEGATVNNNDAVYGSFSSGSYLTSLRSKITSAHGKNGATMREGGTNATTDNRVTGLTATFTGRKNFFVSYDFAVPEGRTFPGASTTNTLPSGVSSAKLCWISQSNLDVIGLPDIVVGTWVGSTFNIAGNDCPITNYIMGSQIDFNGWNEVQALQISGSDPFADNCSLTSIYSNAVSGIALDEKTDTPAYQYKHRYTVSLQTDGYAHRITINGVNCDYVQVSGDTTSIVAAGLRDSITANAIPNVSASSSGSAVIVSASLRTTFTGSGSASLAQSVSNGTYDYISCPGWSGNGSQDLSQIAISRLYIAASDDASCAKRVELLNNASYNLSTIHRPVFINDVSDFWTDTSILLTAPSHTYMEGATHKCLTLENGTQIIEAL